MMQHVPVWAEETSSDLKWFQFDYSIPTCAVHLTAGQESRYCRTLICSLMLTYRCSQLSQNKYRNCMKLDFVCMFVWAYVLSQYLPWERVAQLHIAWGHAAGSIPALQWSSQKEWWTRPCPQSQPSFFLDLQAEVKASPGKQGLNRQTEDYCLNW